MKKFRFTIRNKILGGFFLLILTFIAYTAITIVTINRNSKVTELSSQVVTPSLTAIKDFKELVIRSKMLITNWVYLQSNLEDKEALKVLHSSEYPKLKEDINALMVNWNNENDRMKMDTIFMRFENLLGVHKGIMEELVDFEDYEDFMIKFMAVESIESQVLPESSAIDKSLEELVKVKQKEADEIEATIQEASIRLRNTSIYLGVAITIVGFMGAFFMALSITGPINYIKNIVIKLGTGELPEDQDRKFSNDEIGEMAQAMDKLVAGLKSTSYFAESIGNGNYNSEFQPLSEGDVLGNALINMRDNLQKVAEEDKRRNWATEGLARFGEILRKNNDNLAKLSDEIISNLVKYMKANQGGLYIISDEDDNEPYLKLNACYAWDKKKYLEQRIYEGEGLTGQAWLEKDTIYLTEVPKDYIAITSGLGEANPRAILIVPLKVNEEVYGVIEIASFVEFNDFEIEFVEKIAESIASTISSVKINERTSKLLEESTQLTEQMRAQEEEMRQNMEELQATQEEMHRSQRDREDKEKIISSTNMQIELDNHFGITSTNELVRDVLKYGSGELIGKSFDVLAATKDGYEKLKSNLKDGRAWSGVMRLKTSKGDTVVVQVSAGQTYDPIEGTNRYLFFASDISSLDLA